LCENLGSLFAIAGYNRIKYVSVCLFNNRAQGDCGVKVERVQVICPACGLQVEAMVRDSRVKGYCAIAQKFVDFLIETPRTVQARVEKTAAPAPIRDSKGRFIKKQ
jgi:hypothetical protein